MPKYLCLQIRISAITTFGLDDDEEMTNEQIRSAAVEHIIDQLETSGEGLIDSIELIEVRNEA